MFRVRFWCEGETERSLFATRLLPFVTSGDIVFSSVQPCMREERVMYY
jgi:hypothetical protein